MISLPADLIPDPFDPKALDSFVGESIDRALGPDEATVVELLDHPDDAAPATQTAADWRIANDAQAEWAARKWRRAMEEIAEADAQRDEWVAQIRAWHADAVAKSTVTKLFMQQQLERYGLLRRRADPSAKTTKLPSATIKTTQHGAAVDVADGDAALEWARVRNADIIQKREWLRVSDVRERVKVAERPTGLYDIDLSCGCSIVSALDDAPCDELGNVWLAELIIDCPNHGLRYQAIALSTQTELVAVDSFGDVVESMTVVPSHVSVRVVE